LSGDFAMARRSALTLKGATFQEISDTSTRVILKRGEQQTHCVQNDRKVSTAKAYGCCLWLGHDFVEDPTYPFVEDMRAGRRLSQLIPLAPNPILLLSETRPIPVLSLGECIDLHNAILSAQGSWQPTFLDKLKFSKHQLHTYFDPRLTLTTKNSTPATRQNWPMRD